MPALDETNSFIRHLAANDRWTRDAALEKLRSYISHRRSLEELELMRLWKGLFYCMWMSDKPRTQQRLARDLAGLLDVVQEHVTLAFLDAFWKTMAREWRGVDALRMDKFLYLIRCYLNASFNHFARSGWRSIDTGRLNHYMKILAATPLNPTDPKIPNGLRMHVVDIYVDELDKVDEEREGKMPLDTLLAPLRALEKDSPEKTIRKYVKEALQDERLKDWNTLREVGDERENAVAIKENGEQEQEAMEDDESESSDWSGLSD